MNSRNLELLGRLSFFIIFFWFGILKVFGVSPANELVSALLNVTFLNFIEIGIFSVLFGLFEMTIGIAALFKRIDKITIILLLVHMSTTVMPVLLLPNITWQSIMVPTLLGQYIIKNLILVTLGLYIFTNINKK